MSTSCVARTTATPSAANSGTGRPSRVFIVASTPRVGSSSSKMRGRPIENRGQRGAKSLATGEIQRILERQSAQIESFQHGSNIVGDTSLTERKAELRFDRIVEEQSFQRSAADTR